MTPNHPFSSTHIVYNAASAMNEATHFEIWPVEAGRKSSTIVDIVGEDATNYQIRMGQKGQPLVIVAEYDNLSKACDDYFKLEAPLWYTGLELRALVRDRADMVTQIAVARWNYKEPPLLEKLFAATGLTREECNSVITQLRLHNDKGKTDLVFPDSEMVCDDVFEMMATATHFELRPVLDEMWSGTAELFGRYTTRYQVRMGTKDGPTRLLATFCDLRECQRAFFRLRKLGCPLYYVGLERVHAEVESIVDMLKRIIYARYDNGQTETTFRAICAAAGLSRRQIKQLRLELSIFSYLD